MQFKINIVFGILIVGVTVILIFNFKKQPRISYVNTIELYNDFIYKNELEKKMIETQKARQQILDSLLFNLQILSRQIESKDHEDIEKINRFKVLRNQYLLKKDQFEEDNEALGQKYTEQIWKQLNQYVKDYGEKENCDYIFGTEGQGNIMYADDQRDITKELIKYVNAKYEGVEN